MGESKKKDYMPKWSLDKFIIDQYRKGYTIKYISKSIKNMTIGLEDEPLPTGYAEQIIYLHQLENGAFNFKESTLKG